MNMPAIDITGERTGIACEIISVHGHAIVIRTKCAAARRVVLPAGQVSIDGAGEISMPEWLARDRGLIA